MLGISLNFFYFLVATQIASKALPLDTRPTLSTTNRYSNNLIGSIIITSGGYILISDANGRMFINQTFPYMDQLPIVSAAYQTAIMAVMGDVAYIGGLNGTIFLLQLPVDLLEQASTGGNNLGDPVAGTEVIVSNVTLPFPCIPEAFTSTPDVIAACFSNNDSVIYFVNIHSPFDKSELPFTHDTDLSNILPVDDVFYFVQHDQLFRADTKSQESVERLENCRQPWLMMNKYEHIIIQCMNKAYVYVLPQWSNAPGISNGAWKNKNMKLKPCYGVGHASQSVVFTVDDITMRLYDTRNDFEKTVMLTGRPDASTLTCAWNDSQPVLMYKDKSSSNWMIHQLTEQYETTSVIPFSEGMLPPLVVDDHVINQSVLLFHPTYFLIPSAHQVFIDLHNNISHPMITDDVVLYHAGIYSLKSEATDIKNESPSGRTKDSSTGTLVYNIVAIGLGIILTIVVAGVIIYKQSNKIMKLIRW